MAKLPEFLRGYFWDVEFEELNKEDHWYLITKRVLDRGDSQAVKWLVKEYGLDKIKEVLLSSIDLSLPTAMFWTDILGLSTNDIPSLNKPYSRIPWGLAS